MVSTRIVCRPFIGRSAELEHLLHRRRQAGDGHGGLVLVGGEPGIGKSRLVREFKGRLNRHTATIASSACREFAQKPLGPILETLEQIAKVRGADLVGSTKSERFDLIAGTFERVAAKRTTVVILEDLHWADIDLMQMLRTPGGQRTAALRRHLSGQRAYAGTPALQVVRPVGSRTGRVGRHVIAV